jgi:hypothetical protein
MLTALTSQRRAKIEPSIAVSSSSRSNITQLDEARRSAALLDQLRRSSRRPFRLR